MFVIFIGLVTAGVMKGLKDYRDIKKPAASAVASVAAATILENVTLQDWSQSNRDVVAAINHLCDTMSKTRDDICDLRRAVEDARHTIRGATGGE